MPRLSLIGAAADRAFGFAGVSPPSAIEILVVAGGGSSVGAGSG